MLDISAKDIGEYARWLEDLPTLGKKSVDGFRNVKNLGVKINQQGLS